MKTAMPPNKTYSISIQDKPKKHQSNITEHPVTEDVARKFYFQFLQLWGKKVNFSDTRGVTIEGYLHKVNGKILN